jgi:hypothetical protein
MLFTYQLSYKLNNIVKKQLIIRCFPKFSIVKDCLQSDNKSFS